MATLATADTQPHESLKAWYQVPAESVATQFDVDVANGLSGRRAGDLLNAHGPNALPAEQTPPGWRRFGEQYRSYMQIILVGAAIVSLAIKEWSTAGVLIFISLLNAVVGLRQEGKA